MLQTLADKCAARRARRARERTALLTLFGVCGLIAAVCYYGPALNRDPSLAVGFILVGTAIAALYKTGKIWRTTL